MDTVEMIVERVLKRLSAEGAAESKNPGGIPAEMSARHVHLTKDDALRLFGSEDIPVSRDVSQPGQYLSTLRVRLIGPKGIIDNVGVLGPARRETQVEISATDARALGVTAPVHISGDLKGAGSVLIQAGENVIKADAAIVAMRHLHMTPADAARYGVTNGQTVSVRLRGTRPLILEEVPVRVTEQSALALHIDTDEANAAGLGKDAVCEIVGREGVLPPAREHKPEKPAREAPVFSGKLLTEELVNKLHNSGARKITLKRGQLVTPLARDRARALGLEISAEGDR